MENNISNAYIPMSSRLHLARLSVASAGDLSSALPPDESRWLELLLVFICVWITWPAIMDDISSRPTLHWSSHSNKSSQARHPESYLQQEQFQSGAKEFFIIVAKFVYPNTSWTLFDNTLRLHTPYVIGKQYQPSAINKIRNPWIGKSNFSQVVCEYYHQNTQLNCIVGCVGFFNQHKQRCMSQKHESLKWLSTKPFKCFIIVMSNK